MTVLGREPTLIINAVSGVVAVFVAFGVHGLSAQQAALVVAFTSSLLGVANAVVVRPVAPAAFTGFVAAAAALLTAYGFNVDAAAVGAVQAATVTVLALLTRSQVAPVE